MSLIAESESLSKIIEQLEIFLFLSETKSVLMARSSSVVLEVSSVTSTSDTCVPLKESTTENVPIFNFFDFVSDPPCLLTPKQMFLQEVSRQVA